MLRTFVERKVRRQIVRRSLIISVFAFVAILALWYSDSMASLVHPLRMFVNNIHGGLSALAIQLSGGAVHSFTLSSQGAYRIEFTGGSDALIFPAGYLGSALLGACLFYLANRAPHLLRGLAMTTGVFTVGFMVLFIRPAGAGSMLSMVICIGLGVLLIVMGWTGKGDINQLRSRKTATQILMNIVAMMTALHVILDLSYILQAPAMIDGVITNPVAAFSERVMPAASVDLIATIWSAIALAFLGVSVYFSMLRPLRQIPGNDDIV